MKILLSPPKESWGPLCTRPGIDTTDLEDRVKEIISDVKSGKDKALKSYSLKYDGVILDSLRVADNEYTEATEMVSQKLKDAITVAKTNIESFHSAQFQPEQAIETTRGVKCWRKSVAIEKVGLYIPGGSAPLFSTVLMLGIPAKIAGCKEIVLCTPPSENGKVNPLILYTAHLIGITDIFRVGGAQAIAAMAYGTESIPAVYKIFGPGNQYVTKAKQLVQQSGIAIDMPAGPSEVLVIADENADPEFVASDLISQAEHGPDSQVILLSNNMNLIDLVAIEVEKQMLTLPRKDIASVALENSLAILLPSLDTCIEFSNLYAPEHLIINTINANSLANMVINAGSVFIGSLSCESAGDYASGTNHTLPTNGFARSYSGVSTESFQKKISFQHLDEVGIRSIGPAIELMAEAESLEGHRNAVSVRLKNLNNG